MVDHDDLRRHSYDLPYRIDHWRRPAALNLRFARGKRGVALGMDALVAAGRGRGAASESCKRQQANDRAGKWIHVEASYGLHGIILDNMGKHV